MLAMCSHDVWCHAQDFAKGRCDYGTRCRFSHAIGAACQGTAAAAAPPGACTVHWQTGVCPDRTTCIYSHLPRPPARKAAACGPPRGQATPGPSAAPATGHGGQNLYFFLHGYGMDKPAIGGEQLRKFVQAVVRVADTTELIAELRCPMGLERLRQARGARLPPPARVVLFCALRVVVSDGTTDDSDDRARWSQQRLASRRPPTRRPAAFRNGWTGSASHSSARSSRCCVSSPASSSATAA